MGVAEHFAYDGMGKAILHTDVRGVQHTTTYDLVGRALIETVGAELRTVLRSYVDTSAGGFWTLQEQDANGHSVVHTYDALHREVSTQDAAGKTGRAYFDSVVKRAALDRKGFRTSFEYDGANRLLAQREFEMDGSLKFSQTTLYDDRARTETLTDRRGISTIRVWPVFGVSCSSPSVKLFDTFTTFFCNIRSAGSSAQASPGRSPAQKSVQKSGY